MLRRGGWLVLGLCGVCTTLHAEPYAHMPLGTHNVGLLGPTGAFQLHPLRQALVDVSDRAQVTTAWVRVERHTANVWNSETPLWLGGSSYARHTADLQLEEAVVDAGLPLGRFLAVGVRLGSARMWGGGSVDSAIETFHGVGDFFNFERHRAPQARTLFEAVGPSGPSLRWTSPRPFLLGPQASLFVRLLENRTTTALARATLQLPGDVARALQMGGSEGALGVSLHRRLAGLGAVFLAGHVLFHGNTHLAGLHTEHQLLGSASFELRVLPGLTLLVEDRIQGPLFAKGPKLLTSRALTRRATAYYAYFSPVNIITGGARIYLPGQAALTAYVGEDFMFCTECWKHRYSRETNAPDISLSLVLEQVVPGPGAP